MQMLREKAADGSAGPLSGSRCLFWLVAAVVLALGLHSYFHVVYGELAWTAVEGAHDWQVRFFFGSLAPYAANRLSQVGK